MSTSADTGSGSSAASAPGEQIARVSIEIPLLWRRNVKVWRLQVDAQFANSPVTQELTKYNYVLASLDGDVAELISDLLLKPLSVTPYSDLMNRLQAEFEISEGRKSFLATVQLQLLLCSMSGVLTVGGLPVALGIAVEPVDSNARAQRRIALP
ncbi:hypothetical protein GE061_001633 [Apolygus lucorum]|uniref:DUF7041 domain-containing protein n=1 Tax=Apolygus lucorum TaxID=248454 RepID=A0A8S9Y9X5_APOLU|nr:hypothetical protein GE061_001633 [Apolygus lucorum]